MTEQAQQSVSVLDTAKLVAGAAILAGGIAAFYLLPDLPIWLRWLIVLAALVLGTLVGLQSAPGKTFWGFVQASRTELRKVVWPTAQETRQVTMVVFVMLIVLALFFWALDSLLGFVTRWLATGGG
ncbi:MAG TPA: preprotein translocase subunit SecE [Steroidobacteraceae bacterium]|jgi:preprotein translocase subunit SecE|nr:preprotein translocase subunit SecE [Steroidobacteraceae bacterium]